VAPRAATHPARAHRPEPGRAGCATTASSPARRHDRGAVVGGRVLHRELDRAPASPATDMEHAHRPAELRMCGRRQRPHHHDRGRGARQRREERPADEAEHRTGDQAADGTDAGNGDEREPGALAPTTITAIVGAQAAAHAPTPSPGVPTPTLAGPAPGQPPEALPSPLPGPSRQRRPGPSGGAAPLPPSPESAADAVTADTRYWRRRSSSRASARCPARYKRSWTTTTGRCACASTPSATEPSMAPAGRRCGRPPTTSAWASLASSRRTSTG
jgi:hypothetical protein